MVTYKVNTPEGLVLIWLRMNWCTVSTQHFRTHTHTHTHTTIVTKHTEQEKEIQENSKSLSKCTPRLNDQTSTVLQQTSATPSTILNASARYLHITVVTHYLLKHWSSVRGQNFNLLDGNKAKRKYLSHETGLFTHLKIHAIDRETG